MHGQPNIKIRFETPSYIGKDMMLTNVVLLRVKILDLKGLQLFLEILLKLVH